MRNFPGILWNEIGRSVCETFGINEDTNTADRNTNTTDREEKYPPSNGDGNFVGKSYDRASNDSQGEKSASNAQSDGDALANTFSGIGRRSNPDPCLFSKANGSSIARKNATTASGTSLSNSLGKEAKGREHISSKDPAIWGTGKSEDTRSKGNTKQEGKSELQATKLQEKIKNNTYRDPSTNVDRFDK